MLFDTKETSLALVMWSPSLTIQTHILRDIEIPPPPKIKNKPSSEMTHNAHLSVE